MALAVGLLGGIASPAVAEAGTGNTPPDAPVVTTLRSTPCAPAQAPLMTGSSGLRWQTTTTDPDGGQVTTRFDIVRADGSVAHSAEISTPSGFRYLWPDLPDGTLVHGETYHYRARGDDGTDAGPYSQDCYFTVDSVRPNVPKVSSTDYPNGEPAILERTTGTVTLRPAAGDTDIDAYRYGFDNVRMNQTIKAGPDGSAVLPLTLYPDPLTGRSSERLYVQAVDKAGNLSRTTPSRDLDALPNPAPQAHVDGDLTGDGRADVTALLDYGNGQTKTWNVVATGGGFHAATAVFDTGGETNAPQDRFRQVRGDFDGDGRTDIAMLTQLSSGGLQLWELLSDGAYYAARSVWSSSEDLPISAARTLSGDFTHDGKTDIAVQLGTPEGWRVLVFPGGNLGSPTTWLQSADTDFAHARLVAGDFDGDGTGELAEVRDQGGCQASVRTYRSTGTAFETGVPKWEGAYCADRGTPVTGDVDGDGRDDVVALYDHGDSDTAVMAFTAASGFVPQEWWRHTGEFDATKAVLSTGDFDLDGKADVAVVYDDVQTQLWTLRSTGTAFADRVLGWQEVTGGKPVQSGR